MQAFFNARTEYGSQPVFRPPEWSYINEQLQKNLNTVVNYYSARPFAVKSNHFLSRLINSISVSFNHNLERYYDIVDARALSFSMTMKMSSSLFRGNIFNGVFYGDGTNEILMAVDDVFNPYEVDANWRTTSAVRVLYHSRSDLDLLLPNGKTFSNEKGYAVIAINITMLAVQYRAFLKYQKTNFIDKGLSPQTTAQFIHMHVLPNMLGSHLDIALFNRAFNLLMGAPMGENTKKHPFYLTDLTAKVDKSYNGLIELFKRRNSLYRTIMATFPTVEDKNFLTISKLPDNAQTKQITASEVLARLPFIYFFTTLAKISQSRLNGSEENYFRKEFKHLQTNKIMDSFLPKDMIFDTERTIFEISKNIN